MYDIKLGTRVLMGIPTTSAAKMTVEWIEAMNGLQMPLGSSLGRRWIKDELIGDARNALCKAALEADVEYLFMLGDDVIPPPQTLLALLDKMGRIHTARDGSEHPVEMLTGIYWTKTYPTDPYIFRLGTDKPPFLGGPFKDWKAGEFFDVDIAGCDCLLIDTKVLKKMAYPWFSTEWVWDEDQKVSPIATEDYYFYTKAREAGIRLWADTSIQCMHEDRFTGAWFGLAMDMYQANGMPEVGNDEVLIADVGSGVATQPSLYGPKAKIIRFDEREDAKPDIRCDIRSIDEHFHGKFDWVNASHVLEHFRRSEAVSVVKEWVKLLKPGGTITIHVPNFEHAIKFILDPPPGASAEEKTYAWAQVYGDQAKPGAAWQHLNGFTTRKLRGLLDTIPGLTDIVVEDDGENLKGIAKLGAPVVPYTLTKAWNRIIEKETPVELPMNGTAPMEVVNGAAEELPTIG